MIENKKTNNPESVIRAGTLLIFIAGIIIGVLIRNPESHPKVFTMRLFLVVTAIILLISGIRGLRSKLEIRE